MADEGQVGVVTSEDEKQKAGAEGKFSDELRLKLGLLEMNEGPDMKCGQVFLAFDILKMIHEDENAKALLSGIYQIATGGTLSPDSVAHISEESYLYVRSDGTISDVSTRVFLLCYPKGPTGEPDFDSPPQEPYKDTEANRGVIRRGEIKCDQNLDDIAKHGWKGGKTTERN